MLEKRITRRRALSIFAAASASLLGTSRRVLDDRVEWRGVALGADARIVMLGAQRHAAREAIGDCLAEIERLERVFSLYRSDAELACLNREGYLRDPSLDLRGLLGICRTIHAQSNGLFDPTVQPLWRFYAQWFAGGRDREAPMASERAPLLSRIGMQHVQTSAGSIRLSGAPQITLNGIAQGYITDRVAQLLRARGWSNVLIDLGEVRALDGRPDGTPFSVHVRDTGLELPLANTAIATSSAAALVFSAAQGLAHILHPRTGATPAHWASVTVQNPSATIADALSTALFLAGENEIGEVLARFPGTLVWAARRDGIIQRFGGSSRTGMPHQAAML